MKRTLVVFAALLASTSASALSQYQFEVPNGQGFRCLTCHVRAGGGEGWNDFGKDILRAGGANPDANPGDQDAGFDPLVGTPADYWLDVCGDDSDGDGSTNGEELGDPDCVWAQGDANPDVEPSAPGDPTSVPGDPGDGGGGGGEDPLGGCGGASLAGMPPAVVLGVFALALRRRRR